MGGAERAALRALLARGAAIEVPARDRDDPYILAYAFDRAGADGFVISNDRFRDHAAAVLARAAAAAGGGGAGGGGGAMDVDGDGAGAASAPSAASLPPAAASLRLAWLRSNVLSYALRPPTDEGGTWQMVLDPTRAAALLSPGAASPS
jgi:hypothetical protein